MRPATESPRSVHFANVSVSRPIFATLGRQAQRTATPWWSFWGLPTEEEVKVQCVQGVNCKLPGCLCQSKEIPSNLAPQDVPQMVYVTIEGSINPSVYRRYRQLFKNRYNPNGCGARGTVFSTDRGSYPFVVSRMADIGAELAMQGVNEYHFVTAAQMEEEIIQQKKSLLLLANVTSAGWKTPELKALGNDQFRLLRSFGFTYDATLSANSPKKNDLKPWPFTLDFGYDGKCVIPECPTEKFPGLWEIPTVAIRDYKQMFECTYVDGCMFNPPTANFTEEFLMDNFLMNYKSNKAPFGVHLRQVWFSHPAYIPNVKGLLRFLDKIQQLKDVYLVSASDIIDWIKDPTPLKQITSNRPWGCI